MHSLYVKLIFNSLDIWHYLQNWSQELDPKIPPEVQKHNLVPRVSHLNAWGERGETLVGSGNVSPRIWEMTIYPMKGGAA